MDLVLNISSKINDLRQLHWTTCTLICCSTIVDTLKVKQRKRKNRLRLTTPLLLVVRF